MRNDTDDYRYLFLNDIPLMDVRAPIEFEKGAFPTSINKPILDNEQRQLIGTRYKEQGQDSAIELGWQLATEEIQRQRVSSWKEFTDAQPEGYLYCFRGGLRSRLTQKMLKEAGIQYPLIKGGYKALRRFLIDELENNIQALDFVLLSGKTGSGKTRVLKQVTKHVDLEGLAKHRGSSFGHTLEEQPAQINFENELSIQFMKKKHSGIQRLMLEDEGRLIGRVALPDSLQLKMKQASPMVKLDTTLEERIEIGIEDYVLDLLPKHKALHGEELAVQSYGETLLHNLTRIRKRLGNERYGELHDQFSQAIRTLQNQNSTKDFEAPIARLLTDYYDPMYEYQFSKREGKVLFQGDKQSVIDWTNHNL